MNKESEETNAEPLGHGDHWQAMGLEGEPLIEYLHELAKKADEPRFFLKPWPDDEWPGGNYSKVALMSQPRGYLSLMVLFGINEREKALSMVSAFPVFTRTSDWIVRVGAVSAAYGPYEGVVCVNASTGHQLRFFAPYFGLEVDHWRRKGLARVALSGLALRLETFEAEPIRVTEGPFVEDAKRELRAAGNNEDADDPDFHVTVETDKMRTLYSLNHDHHQIIGRVVAVATARPSPRFQGWRLEIECMPDEAASGCRLPVFVFPPALGSETPPRKGDLVTGVVWLQGSWIDGESERNLQIWNEAGPEDSITPQCPRKPTSDRIRMSHTPRHTCNYQLAGYAFDFRDEMGPIDFPSFKAAFEEFPWGEQMRQREKMAGGCSATITVEDQEANLALWVSVMGDDRRPTFLLGAVWDLEASTRVAGSDEEVDPCDIWIAPSRRSVLSVFRLLFGGERMKLKERLSSYQCYDTGDATFERHPDDER